MKNPESDIDEATEEHANKNVNHSTPFSKMTFLDLNKIKTSL